ncbi:MAG: ABC transporter permease subunit [Oscillochloris sp.]|nr:ABC transporter permease subunit [Oscillochloris sp.]
MNFQTISIITRREVRETLSDWRIVTPILLLTFLLPQLLVIAADQVVTFVAGDDLAGRLVPFAALLVGFVPASFSLITALESFVGERERGSLESLLAMPLSDNDLYIGKLCSALLTPVTSSLIAMTVFVGLLLGFERELYFQAMTPDRLLLLLVLVLAMAFVMVNGAVVISSHITTVRAANLMSSFILLPLAGVMQLAAILIINDRWSQLWLLALTLMALAGVLLRIGMRSFSREELLSREHVQGQLRFGLRLPRIGFVGGWRRPTIVIARRELGEILSDWRMLVPLSVLVIGLPLAMVAGVDFAIGFVNDGLILGRLVPFAGLLMGFVPASFALILAIESFVGERERNTLESLLALPLNDRALYTGKLVAALSVPMLASLLAMTVFFTAIRLLYPTLYATAMTPLVLVQVTLMILVITLLMVAGAVVISTHTGSVRAATLLASGVLVPTSVVIQLQAILFIARRYDLLWFVLAGLAVIALALVRSGLASFNREEILSREHEELNIQRIRAVFSLFFREYHPAGMLPNAYADLPFSARRFYTREFPALLRELRVPIGFVVLGALGGMLTGGYIGQAYNLPAFNAILDQLGKPPAPSGWLAAGIFANNLRVSILSNMFSTVSFGVFAYLVPAVAFAQIGFVATMLNAQGGSWLTLGADSPLQFVLAYVAPHGIVELPTFILSAALGLRIGAALLAPPAGFTVGQNLIWALSNFAKTWLLVILPLVALGAMIEGLITPRIVLMLYGM